MGVAGWWVRRAFVRWQLGERRLDVVDDARVADLDEPQRNGGGQVVDDVCCGAIGSDGPQGTQLSDGEEDRPAGLAVPGRSEDRAGIRPVRLDEGGHGFRSDPRHPDGPQEDGARIADLVHGKLRATDHLTDRASLCRCRGTVDRFGADQRRHDRSVVVGRDHDDRQGAAGPADIR